MSTLRGSYGKRKGLGARLRCPLSVLRGIYRRFVLLLDVEVRFDCAGSHKVSWQLLSASVLRGIYRRFVLLLDVEMRFDCAGSHKVRCRLLSASVSRGIYRRFLLLLDVEVRFDCAGSHKLVAFCFFGGSGDCGGFVSWSGGTGFRRKVSGSIPALSARACFPFFWACLDGASVLRRRLDGTLNNNTQKQQQQQRHNREQRKKLPS